MPVRTDGIDECAQLPSVFVTKRATQCAARRLQPSQHRTRSWIAFARNACRLTYSRGIFLVLAFSVVLYFCCHYNEFRRQRIVLWATRFGGYWTMIAENESNHSFLSEFVVVICNNHRKHQNKEFSCAQSYAVHRSLACGYTQVNRQCCHQRAAQKLRSQATSWTYHRCGFVNVANWTVFSMIATGFVIIPVRF